MKPTKLQRALVEAMREIKEEQDKASMNSVSFADMKLDTLALIEKIKASNPERGAYLERHIVLDDKNETMTYTGKPEIIQGVLNAASL